MGRDRAIQILKSLQAGRFFAAMVVVLHHAGISSAAFVTALPPSLDCAASYGYLGVDFFFVLSGFIIHYSMTRTPRTAQVFAYDRLCRIMLPYLPVGVGLAVAYTAMPSLSAVDRSWSWLASLTLLPTTAPPALSVAWTLQHELVFYGLYSLFRFTNRMTLGLVVWSLLIIAYQFTGLTHSAVLNTFFSAINIEFVFGVIAASMFMSKRYPSSIAAMLTAGLLLYSFVWIGGNREQSWIVGAAIAVLLPWICHQEQLGAFKVPAWLVWGGAASYAIYLTHNPLLSLVYRAMKRLDLGWQPAILSALLISLAVGAAYHLFWERPVMRIARPSQKHA